MIYFSMMRIILERQWYVYRHRMNGLLINFLLLSPLKVASIQGYVKPMMYFGYPLGRRAMLVFAGSVLMYFIHRSFSFATGFFFDIAQQRQIELQSQRMPLWLVYGTRILFTSLFTWCVLLPMMPLCKVILRSDLYTDDVRWPLYGLVVFLIAFMMNSYAFMCVSLVGSIQEITKIRVRINEVLMWLGAFNIPWSVMNKSHYGWGLLALCNPFTYGTEALRGALVPGPDVISPLLTLPGLVFWIAFFLYVGYKTTSRRVWNGQYDVAF